LRFTAWFGATWKAFTTPSIGAATAWASSAMTSAGARTVMRTGRTASASAAAAAAIHQRGWRLNHARARAEMPS
jgi:hypothetical protein